MSERERRPIAWPVPDTIGDAELWAILKRAVARYVGAESLAMLTEYHRGEASAVSLANRYGMSCAAVCRRLEVAREKLAAVGMLPKAWEATPGEDETDGPATNPE